MYDNSLMAVGYTYLEEYRDEKYISQATEGMTPEETREFALTYFGWDNDRAHDKDKLSLEEQLIELGY